MIGAVDAVALWLRAVAARIGSAHVADQGLTAHGVAAGHRHDRVLPAMRGAHPLRRETRERSEHHILDALERDTA